MRTTKKQKLFRQVLLYGGMAIFSVILLIPFVWMFISSLKLDKDILTVPIQWIPKNPRWRNYLDIWGRIPLAQYFINTIKITVITTCVQLFTSSFAAYAFAKLQFKHRDTLFLAYIATIAVPWQVYMVPQFIMLRSWHLNDTHFAIILIHSFTAFGVFLMRQFYMGIPDSLCEAARIDGMTEYGIYAKIMLPLSKPALSTLFIFTFVNTWNDFLGPYIYLTTKAKKTVQIGLRVFLDDYTQDYGMVMTASVITLIPVLIIFLSMQKYFVEGIASTGIKG